MVFNTYKRRWMRKELGNSAPFVSNGFKWPKTMLVITDTVDKREVDTYYEWAKKLGIQSQELQVITKVKDAKNQEVSRAHVVDEKLIKWNGGISNRAIEELLNATTDLQVNVCQKEDALVRFMDQKSAAQLKVNLGNGKKEYHDLDIRVNDTENDVFINELDKYLKIICKS